MDSPRSIHPPLSLGSFLTAFAAPRPHCAPTGCAQRSKIGARRSAPPRHHPTAQQRPHPQPRVSHTRGAPTPIPPQPLNPPQTPSTPPKHPPPPPQCRTPPSGGGVPSAGAQLFVHKVEQSEPGSNYTTSLKTCRAQSHYPGQTPLSLILTFPPPSPPLFPRFTSLLPPHRHSHPHRSPLAPGWG